MTDPITRTLSRKVLAGIIEAPHWQAQHCLLQLETSDFDHWIDAALFDALKSIDVDETADHETILLALNRHFMATGKYQGQDNGLRAAIVDLVQTRGDVNLLQEHVDDLIEHRFRTTALKASGSLAAVASGGTLPDVNGALNRWHAEHWPELLRLWDRLPERRRVNA